jgi:hypothetical protein
MIIATALMLTQSVCWFAPESDLANDPNWRVNARERRITMTHIGPEDRRVQVDLFLARPDWAGEGQGLSAWQLSGAGPSGWPLSHSSEWRERTDEERTSFSARALALNYKVCAQAFVFHGAPREKIKSDVEGYVRGVVAMVNARQVKEAGRTQIEGKSIASFTIAGGDSPLVELESAAQALGAKVEANRRTYLFKVTKGGRELTLAMGSGKYELRGQPRKQTQSTSFIEDGKAYVPLAALMTLK